MRIGQARFAATVVALVAGTVLLVGASTALGAPVVTCGSVITEDTTLTSSVRNCSEGLEVAASGVTLDLGGYTIAGRGAGGTGVRITAAGVTVRDGKITGFATGVGAASLDYEDGSHRVPDFHLRSLKLTGNGLGVSACCGPQFGPVSTIESSQIERNSQHGISAGFARIDIRDTSIRSNGGHGIFSTESPGSYERNDISRNGGDGVHAKDRPLTLIDNRLNGNGGSGLSLSHHFLDPLAQSYLERNEASRNGGLGLYLTANGDLPWAGVDGGGNAAWGNGDKRQCLVTASFGAEIPAEALSCATKPSGP
jgi:hypothetical protein